MICQRYWCVFIVIGRVFIVIAARVYRYCDRVYRYCVCVSLLGRVFIVIFVFIVITMCYRYRKWPSV